jgi:alkylation response protein AidB-like acyl-CoA dehydrogenase
MNTAIKEAEEWSLESEVKRLGKVFASRAADYDARDGFVAENVTDLKAAGIYGAGVPLELGGFGVTYSEMAGLLRSLAHDCGSTALALAMHQHQVAMLVWKWRNLKAPVEGLLTRIAREQLVLVSTGGADWLQGSGVAERVEGGFRVSGRKIFASGSPVGNLLMTTAIYNDPKEGPIVLHVPLSMQDPDVRVVETWHAMGMRGTGSHDVEIRDVFVPDAAVVVRRAQGQWHPVMHIVSMIALPLVYAVYTGIAEAMRDDVVSARYAHRHDHGLQEAIGALETELKAAQLACQAMIAAGAEAAPGPETTNHVMAARALVERSVLSVASQAMDLVGGAAFSRGRRLERLFRDIQGARYHPIRGPEQRRFAGRLAFGLPVDA